VQSDKNFTKSYHYTCPLRASRALAQAAWWVRGSSAPRRAAPWPAAGRSRRLQPPRSPLARAQPPGGGALRARALGVAAFGVGPARARRACESTTAEHTCKLACGAPAGGRLPHLAGQARRRRAHAAGGRPAAAGAQQGGDLRPLHAAHAVLPQLHGGARTLGRVCCCACLCLRAHMPLRSADHSSSSGLRGSACSCQAGGGSACPYAGRGSPCGYAALQRCGEAESEGPCACGAGAGSGHGHGHGPARAVWARARRRSARSARCAWSRRAPRPRACWAWRRRSAAAPRRCRGRARGWRRPRRCAARSASGPVASRGTLYTSAGTTRQTTERSARPAHAGGPMQGRLSQGGAGAAGAVGALLPVMLLRCCAERTTEVPVFCLVHSGTSVAYTAPAVHCSQLCPVRLKWCCKQIRFVLDGLH